MPAKVKQTPPTSDTAPKQSSAIHLQKTLMGHTGTISRMVWSPDGRYLASASRDQTVRIWDTETGDVRHTLNGHTGWAIDVAWSPDGQRLASCADDRTVRLWDMEHGICQRILGGHESTVKAVAWSPDGKTLATGSEDKTIRLWNLEQGDTHTTLHGHSGSVFSLDWSPDGKHLASGAADFTVRIWNVENQKTRRILRGHTKAVYCVQFSPNGGQMVAACSNDRTTRVWDATTGRELTVLEGHTNGVNCLSYAAGGLLLATKGDDVRLWRTDTWELLDTIPEADPGIWPPGVAFHPAEMKLVTLADRSDSYVIRLWNIDVPALLDNAPGSKSVQYTNAKVVLLGDTGVGKTGLGLVLTGYPFMPTESTHGRHIWSLATTQPTIGNNQRETREILLWDLAGQPGYRLVHQLHLDQVSLALVLFDARSETDPFAGVRHWVRALDQAQRTQQQATPLKKVLVAARADRGTVAVSRDRIDRLVAELKFDAYMETSAKEGWGVDELRRFIEASIPWDNMPKVKSPRTFQQIKDFATDLQNDSITLSPMPNLYQDFVKRLPEDERQDDLRPTFEAGLARMQSRGLVRVLGFGDLVLLQPELLDAYASALINAARDEPNGWGAIEREAALRGDFKIPGNLKSNASLDLLMSATIQDLINYEIALVAEGEESTFLVFPSQFTREHPEYPDPKGKTVTFHFKGAVLNVYSTLVVRLSHSGVFTWHDMWKNAAMYSAASGGKFGLFLDERGEGEASLTLFFDEGASEEMRLQFELFIERHIKTRAIPDTIHRQQIFACPQCQTPVSPAVVEKLRQHKRKFVRCQICTDVKIPIMDSKASLTKAQESQLNAMQNEADDRRDTLTASEVLQAKMNTRQFDVFLCHISKDKPEVKQISQQLKARGINPWLDVEQIPPGKPWKPYLEENIQNIKAAAVFIGNHEQSFWQQMEIMAFLDEFKSRDCPIIPVILPSCTKAPELPPFLRQFNWVDFRTSDPEPVDHLIWGITGRKDKDMGGPQK